MNRILPGISERQKSPSSGINAGRWTEWARSLIGRFSWIHLRYHKPAMILLQPGIPIYMHSQRWEQHGVRFYPKVNLAIGMVLQMIGYYSKINRELTFEPHAPAGPRAYNISHFSPVKKLFLSDVSPRNGESAMIPSAGEERKELRTSHGVGFPALSQVFARMNHSFRSSSFGESSIRSKSHTIIKRIFDERRRVEGRIHKMAVMQKQKEIVLRVEKNELESESVPRTRMNAWPQASSPPAINVEQLTEDVIRRIDHRIRAYRERKGRAF